MSILNNVNSAADLKKLNTEELNTLCTELRSFLITNISHTGGHLAANLGMVELTVALLRSFDFPADKIVFDVGHQSYIYKILTGRRDRFGTLRKKGGLCGFPRPTESSYDCFATGHSSTSISAALGLSTSMRLSGDKHFSVAVIGDGAFTGGLAYEGLNNAGRYGKQMMVILNDNEHSINKNVGAMPKYLSRLTSRPKYFKVKDDTKRIIKKLPVVGDHLYKLIHRTKQAAKDVVSGSTFFEQLGFIYFGPIDGHDIKQLENVIARAKTLDRPAFIHVKTQKGRGYHFAEQSPQNFHGIADFDIESGKPINKASDTFSTKFGKYLCEMAEKDKRICAITAAMTDGVGLTDFSKKFHSRFFDVGIAEQHAVTFAAGLAANGHRPVAAIYSSFLQRAYDQIIHDVCLQKLPVILAVDRAGLVGEDGETHQGVFDVPMLLSAPEITVYSPYNYRSLKSSIAAGLALEAPCAVRYPRGSEKRFNAKEIDDCFSYFGDADPEILFITYGRIAAECEKAAAMLKADSLKAAVLIITRIKPLDLKVIFEYSKTAKKIIFVEESILSGGLGEHLAACFAQEGLNKEFIIKAVPNQFIEHATPAQQLTLCGLDSDSLYKSAVTK